VTTRQSLPADPHRAAGASRHTADAH